MVDFLITRPEDERADSQSCMLALRMIASGDLTEEWAMRALFPATAAEMHALENQWAGQPHSNTDWIECGTGVAHLETRESHSRKEIHEPC